MGNVATMKLALSLCLALLLVACGRPGASVAEGAPKLEGERIVFPTDSPQKKLLVSTPVEAAHHETLSLNGRLTWDESHTVRVFAPLGGQVVRLVAQPGQSVKAGDALAVIASPDFGQAQAEAARAQVDYALAEKALNRAIELHEHGIIAEKDLQQAQADYERARAERERTARRARLYGGGTAVHQQFVLRAPIAGTVVERNINPGQEVRPDQALPGNPALFVISDPRRLWVQLEIPEAALRHVRPGVSFRLRSPVLGEEMLTGRIEWVADSLDPVTRTMRARGTVSNADRRLKAEMFVTADLDIAADQTPRVPATAVILLGNQQYVFIDEGDGRYVRRKIVAEEAGLGRMRVREGLRVGDKVVTDGALLLQQLIMTQNP
ncbi:efflux RND transporter periplasmic adaptor subunit [Pelomicrobium methylotrophicum]|uniref:Efflux RND transporter periplasmic adaptor subunit n=1 Tax=Pelomicrobium methylotrophicum TaxID=2602750 RepID=A0A5C7EHJ6_9PROT|nr:efflux RND transporter periplasmic adaptor subunit [Pelomicrobium methylotrophicum]TXF10779.1 efflux RND transporter periplasmic adaptor subunit [Pelomicrobium methylotrophicum]